MNKKGQTSFGKTTFYILGTILALSVIWYFVVEYAIIGNLIPILKNYIITQSLIPSETQTLIIGNYMTIAFYLRLCLYILWLVAILILIIMVFRREAEVEII